MRNAFEDPTPHSTTFIRVIGVIGAVLAFVAAVLALVLSITEFTFMALFRTPLNYCVLVFFILFSILMLLIEIFPGSLACRNVVESAAFLGQLFGRGWFYFVLGIFYVCSGYIVCAAVGVYLLVVGVIFVTLGAIRHEEGQPTEEKVNAKVDVVDV